MAAVRRPRRLFVAAAFVAAWALVLAPPAAAHGVGGRTDLPLPLWMFAYGAGAALVVSFVALRVLWPRPRLRAAAEGAALPGSLERVAPAGVVLGRVVGLAALVVVLASAWLGDPSPGNNLAPVAVYVVFWVGMQLASAVVGDVWRALDPLDTLAAAGSWARRRVSSNVGRAEREDLGQWTAAAGLASFVWVELAYHDSASPRAVAVWLSLYVVAALAGAAWWGRGWLRHGEGFAVLFSMLAHLAPFWRDDSGRLRVRAPFSGLARYRVMPGTAAVVLVVLGSTTFDGLSRTEFWLGVVADRSGWALTTLNTMGLVWTIAIMALAYTGATKLVARVTARDWRTMSATFLPSLVPILLAYTLAHYFSLLVFEGQGAWALLSDPFGWEWDLFGTAERAIDFTVLSAATIAYVQAGSIVVGHVVGVVAAHDRAVELFRPRLAERSQYPMLGVMVLYTVGGLGLLLGG
ncbi:MAG: hypothetical protein KY439_09560 [Actinobacteria bacterium]|nr:hypothetical protein [Actinomycetota bacterium]